MQAVIKLQSVSDIITNSSSEVFCRITSDTQLDAIRELLKPLFGGDNSELYPTIGYDGESEDNSNIEIWMPYGYENLETFFKTGLLAILDKYFEGKYKIKW